MKRWWISCERRGFVWESTILTCWAGYRGSKKCLWEHYGYAYLTHQVFSCLLFGSYLLKMTALLISPLYHTSWVLLTSALFFRDSSLPSEHLPHFLPLLRAVHLLTSPNYRKRHTWGNVRLWIAMSSSRGTHTPLPPGIWCAGFDRWSFFQLNKQKSGQFSRKTSDLHHTRTTDRLHSITFNMHDWISVISYWKLAIGSSIYDKVCHVYTWCLHLIISRQCSTWPFMYSFKRNKFLKKIDLKWLKQKVLAKGFIHITAYSGEEPPT